MIPAPFDYDVAESVDHAVELLGQGDGDAKALAGGQSLIPALRLRIARPAKLVDLGAQANGQTKLPCPTVSLAQHLDQDLGPVDEPVGAQLAGGDFAMQCAGDLGQHQPRCDPSRGPRQQSSGCCTSVFCDQPSNGDRGVENGGQGDDISPRHPAARG